MTYLAILVTSRSHIKLCIIIIKPKCILWYFVSALSVEYMYLDVRAWFRVIKISASHAGYRHIVYGALNG